MASAEALYGGALIGVFISLVLYGIILGQTFVYYRSYQGDMLHLKGFVGLVVLIDSVHSVFSMILVYNIFVHHYGDPEYLNESHLLIDAYPALVGMLSCAVQLFFAWRVRVLSGSIYLFGSIAILCVGNFATGLLVSVEAGMGKVFVGIADFKRLVLIWLSISMATEIILTGALTWFLRKPTLFLSSSNDIIRRIANLTLSNGLITTLWTMADIICNFKQTSPGAHMIFCYPLAKLYIITMMSTLNIRPTFHEIQMQGQTVVKFPSTSQNSSFPISYKMRQRSSCSEVESQTPPAFQVIPFGSRPMTYASDNETEMPPRREWGGIN